MIGATKTSKCLLGNFVAYFRGYLQCCFACSFTFSESFSWTAFPSTLWKLLSKRMGIHLFKLKFVTDVCAVFVWQVHLWNPIYSPYFAQTRHQLHGKYADQECFALKTNTLYMCACILAGDNFRRRVQHHRQPVYDYCRTKGQTPPPSIYARIHSPPP